MQVIVTGSQIPAFETRSDGRDNLVGALIMANLHTIYTTLSTQYLHTIYTLSALSTLSTQVGALIMAGNFSIPEVTVYFNHKLLRGNRTVKVTLLELETNL